MLKTVEPSSPFLYDSMSAMRDASGAVMKRTLKVGLDHTTAD
jgi:hypothetical protein